MVGADTLVAVVACCCCHLLISQTVGCVVVLPAFNVTLTPRKSFLSLEDSGLEVEVLARLVSTHTHPPTHTHTQSRGKWNKQHTKSAMVEVLTGCSRSSGYEGGG